MREFSTPLVEPLPEDGSLTDDLLRWDDEAPDRPLFARRTADGWEDVSAQTFHREVRALAKGFLASGIDVGDRVALLSRTRYEWTLVDYALWYVGAVGVPLYPSSSVEQVRWILDDAEPVAIVVEDAAGELLVEQAGSTAGTNPRQAWVIEGSGLADLESAGAAVTDADLEARRSSVTLDSAASIVYTSGTTGSPKGCLLTHRNLTVELAVALPELSALFDDPEASTLLFLPLAHIFARVIQVGAVKSGVRLGHTWGMSGFLDDLSTFQPSFLLAVPRVFERLFNAASQAAAVEGRSRTFDRATETAIAYSKGQDRGRIGAVSRAQHALYERTVYGRIRQILGGRCRFVVSGGAPLGERLGHYYRGVGITVLEGYGLTETTAAVTTNSADDFRIGTVGRPLPGTSLRVSDEGELLVQGGQVFSGYWRNDVATAAVFDGDGWLRTGDLGDIDDEGYVRISGRREELLVTTGGKTVSPGPLEDLLRAHPLIGQALVVGDGRPYLGALVALDRDHANAWAKEHRKSADLATLVVDADLIAEVQGAVDAANEFVSRAEAIRRFTVVSGEWSEDRGQLTPSLKLRRNVVLREHASDVERLFEN